MKEEFMRLPAPLRKQIFIRMGVSAIALLLFLLSCSAPGTFGCASRVLSWRSSCS